MIAVTLHIAFFWSGVVAVVDTNLELARDQLSLLAAARGFC